MRTLLSILVSALTLVASPCLAGSPSLAALPPAPPPAATARPKALDLRQIDKVCARIERHARDYPPTFADDHERSAVENELRGVLDLLDAAWEKNPRALQANPELLLRLGVLHSLGHNLDFPGSPDKADLAFRQLLAIAPEHPQGNYRYGLFLLSVPGYQAEGLDYLEKALRLGVEEAQYTIGLNLLMSGRAETGLRCLEEYARRHPHSRAPMVIESYKACALEPGPAD
jgi:tetratricopeptide (TPR) repeat protein